jgi:hypothetical protein
MYQNSVDGNLEYADYHAASDDVDLESVALGAGVDLDDLPPTPSKPKPAEASGSPSPENPENPENPETKEAPIVWLDDFCKLPPEPNWLVRGYLELNSLAAFFGDSEAGKSFLMVDLTCHIGHGLHWCGRKVKQSPVLYIAGEGGAGLRRRFKAWHEHHGLPITPNIAVRTVAASLCEPEATGQLVDLIDTYMVATRKTPGLIVVDTVNRNFGAGDENSSRDMTLFTQGLDALRTATKGCVAGVHHCGHADKGRMRAAIALHNAIDFEYLIERTGDRKDLSSLRTTLETTKCKDSGDPGSLTWAWKLQSLPWAELDDNDNPVPMSSCVLIHDPNPQPTAKRPVLGDNQIAALEALKRLYQEQQDNLTAGGIEGTPRVSIKDWNNAMKGYGVPAKRTTETRNALLEKKLVALEGECYVRPL